MTLTVTVNGLTHGTDSDDLRILRPSNLWAAPDLRTNDTDIPGSHGVAPGADIHGARRVSLHVQLRAPAWASWETALERMPDVVAAWAPSSTDTELRWTDDTGDYLMRGRTRQAAPNMELAGAGIVTFECRFVATDPFIYSQEERLVGTVAPLPPEGFGFPIEFPIEFGAAGEGGAMNVRNNGNAPAPWKALFVGPCVEPRLVGPNGAITYGGALGDGEQLHIDSRARTVLLAGTASRFALLTEFDWFTIPPGEHALQFQTATSDGAVFLSSRDTWW